MHAFHPSVLFDHLTLQSMPLLALIGHGGATDVLPRERAGRPRIMTKYHPDDGYHAARFDPGDFDPLYRAGSYLIFVTGTVRDAVVNRPAMFALIGGGGWFGMVDQVTADAIRIRPIRAGRPAAAIPRDRVEMVYIPVDRLPDSATVGGLDER